MNIVITLKYFGRYAKEFGIYRNKAIYNCFATNFTFFKNT